MKISKNVGGIDRALRLTGAVVLFYLGFVDQTILEPGTSKTLVGLFGFMPLLTGGLAFCPLYTLVGISTCPMKQVEE